MLQVTVDTRYRIVIPREIREKMKIRSGQRLRVWMSGGNIIFSPKK